VSTSPASPLWMTVEGEAGGRSAVGEIRWTQEDVAATLLVKQATAGVTQVGVGKKTHGVTRAPDCAWFSSSGCRSAAEVVGGGITQLHEPRANPPSRLCARPKPSISTSPTVVCGDAARPTPLSQCCRFSSRRRFRLNLQCLAGRNGARHRSASANLGKPGGGVAAASLRAPQERDPSSRSAQRSGLGEAALGQARSGVAPAAPRATGFTRSGLGVDEATLGEERGGVAENAGIAAEACPERFRKGNRRPRSFNGAN